MEILMGIVVHWYRLQKTCLRRFLLGKNLPFGVLLVKAEGWIFLLRDFSIITPCAIQLNKVLTTILLVTQKKGSSW